MFDELTAFEKELLRSAIRVDAAYRDIVRAQVEKAKLEEVITTIEDGDTHEVERSWLPICVTPDRLWHVYTDAQVARSRMVNRPLRLRRRTWSRWESRPDFRRRSSISTWPQFLEECLWFKR